MLFVAVRLAETVVNVSLFRFERNDLRVPVAPNIFFSRKVSSYFFLFSFYQSLEVRALLLIFFSGCRRFPSVYRFALFLWQFSKFTLKDVRFFGMPLYPNDFVIVYVTVAFHRAISIIRQFTQSSRFHIFSRRPSVLAFSKRHYCEQFPFVHCGVCVAVIRDLHPTTLHRHLRQ